MRLLLLRHGQTSSNVEGILDAAYPGPGLTPLGRAQAEAVPAALAQERIDGLHVSPLLRTQETAAPLAAALGISPQITRGLEEISAGDLQGRRDEDAVHVYRSGQARWAGGDLTGGLPGGESGEQFWGRFTGALRHIARVHGPDATVVSVSHGAAIRVFASVVAGLGADAWHDRPLYNTGMVTLIGGPDEGWELTDWISDPVGGAHLLADIEHDVTADDDAEAAV